MAKLKKSAKKLIIIIIIGYNASSVLYERIIFSICCVDTKEM